MLKDYFRPHVSTMCEDCQARFEKNPLRMIDCKIDGGKEVVQNAPRLIDHLCDDCKAHFETLKNKLDVIGIKYEIDPNIVRGLDYYTRTVFEFVSENVGTQGTICGGGRYDGLVENCGGAPTPGIGFAMGVERLLLEAEAQGIEFEKNDSVKIYLAGMSDAANEKIAKICYELRTNGIGCETDLMNRSFKAQMKYAGKSGIPFLAVIGDDELNTGKVNIKKMDDGSQTEVELDKIIDFLKR
jgi:histidyl-tRNA synthetase